MHAADADADRGHCRHRSNRWLHTCTHADTVSIHLANRRIDSYHHCCYAAAAAAANFVATSYALKFKQTNKNNTEYRYMRALHFVVVDTTPAFVVARITDGYSNANSLIDVF